MISTHVPDDVEVAPSDEIPVDPPIGRRFCVVGWSNAVVATGVHFPNDAISALSPPDDPHAKPTQFSDLQSYLETGVHDEQTFVWIDD